ncbi:hypothetical protein BCR34DRAFT_553569 [Clohesyomyces aquaticus]|uniref:F-box domain-containing protein n=1 Tax=Clohesyomyces aquaticus TaxID=1231657 RepID=A0A1Y2A937_9PLEO|nr:hypothetical protein BCR34DRAFT_553569 [Clohesyomyces aquaticus]
MSHVTPFPRHGPRKPEKTFLLLPGELRNKIYRHIFLGRISVISWETNSGKVPGICGTNRQIRSETITLYFQHMVWLLPHTRFIRPWAEFLHSYPHDLAFHNIRSLVLQDLSVLDTKLLMRCSKLRTLVLVFDGSEIVGKNLVRRAKWDTEKILKIYHLGPIFKSTTLKRLMLGFKPFPSGWIIPGVEEYDDVRASFVHQIERQGNRANVVVLSNLPWNTAQWVEEVVLNNITDEEE